MYDLIIIGGGVAGMTAAVYAKRAGMSVLILEKGGFGGQVALTSTIENYPSYKEIEGFELAASMKAQIDALGVESVSADVTGLSKADGVFTVNAASGDYQGKTVIIANGVKRRELHIEGEDKLRGRGISWCAVCDGGFFRRKTVAVIGAGNSALGDAIYLSNICEKVYVIFRREQPTASKSYLDKLAGLSNVILMPRHIPLAFIGEKRITSLKVKNIDTGEERELEVGGVFEAIGLIPDNEIFKDLVELDENGYILTDSEMKTKTEGLFAAGDTTQKQLRQIVTACADGAVAATSAHHYLNS
ncbi:MAG: FAD-dependent oxidoreductase [Ruminococcus sp.]|nr:FAD-dependent oxidoreductase [Ruminococcus sp.]